MKEIDTQKLNKKLAEWAGFRMGVSPYNDACLYYPDGSWSRDEDMDSDSVLFFTNSLDACEEHLFPKLWELGVTSIVFGKDYCCLEFGYSKSSILEEAKPLALALCLVTARLIDEKG